MTLIQKPFFLTAKGGSSITATINPCTFDSNGVLTVGTGKSLKGKFKRFSVSVRPQKDNVSSVDSDKANNLPIEENLQVSFEEMQCYGVGVNALPVLYTGYDAFQVILGYANRTYTAYVSRGDYEDGIESKGNGTIKGTADLIDVGQIGVILYNEA